MAKTKISQYDATAANNTDIDSINIAEGMAPSNVNNAIRELMAHLKDMDAGTQALTSPQLTSADINGGTIDGVTIGGASAGASTFTNLTATGTTTLAGASTSADITFGDNDKAIFGAGSDLQIYHDGSNSWISELGTGDLRLGAVNIRIGDNTSGASYIYATQNAEVTLYHNNSPKLATTSTGVDITGTAVTDGLTVAGNVSVDGGTIKLDGNYPTGTNNVALGDAAFAGSLSGDSNIAIGFQSHYSLTSGNANTSVGRGSGFATTTGGNNVAVGYTALANNTTASNNTALGMQSLNSNTTASNNTAVGYQAGYSNTTGALNTFLGRNSGYNNSTGTSITAVGQSALGGNTTGNYNTALGDNALTSNTTASNNTAMGYQAGYSNQTGAYLTATGYFALKSSTADGNTAMGYNAAGATSTGAYNTAQGFSALAANSSGGYNTALGASALNANTTASSNTAVGYQTMYDNTTGAENVAIGRLALQDNTSGSYNVALGMNSLALNTTASESTMVGYQAGYTSNANKNQFFGHGAGYHVSSGAKNLILGCYNGNQGGLDIRTSSNNIVLSDGDGNPRLHYNNSANAWRSIEIYNNTTGSAANMVSLSSGSIVRSTSSLRYKRDVADATHGLSDVLNLRPVTYKGIGTEEGDTVYGGLIAEEVHAAGLTEFVQYDTQGRPDALHYGNMVSLCIKAIQEQQATITALEARITALEGA